MLDDKETIVYVIRIFAKYPPLTSKIKYQLKFLKVCLEDSSVEHYLKKRNFKYSLQNSTIKNLNDNFNIPYYFPAWLSGFMEANAGFSIKIKENNYLPRTLLHDLSNSLFSVPSYLTYSFTIGYHNDYYILNSIKAFFNIRVKIRNKNKTFYYLETYKTEDLNLIISHCNIYPLLGQKSVLLDKFVKVFHK